MKNLYKIASKFEKILLKKSEERPEFENSFHPIDDELLDYDPILALEDEERANIIEKKHADLEGQMYLIPEGISDLEEKIDALKKYLNNNVGRSKQDLPYQDKEAVEQIDNKLFIRFPSDIANEIDGKILNACKRFGFVFVTTLKSSPVTQFRG